MPKNLDVIPSLRSNHARRGIAVAHEFASLGHLQVLDLPAGANVREIIAQYQASGLVEFAEPDYLIHSAALPNDPAFANGTLWGLRNLGQNGGRAGMDINAPAAWDITHDAPTVIVAIIDSGIRETHQDLSANLWVNTAEISGNGRDDDLSGYVDDVHGINAITRTGKPTDDAGHGTHVAGIIGAVGNNGLGVTGVAWKVQLMALKFLTSDGTGLTSDAIRCIDYARAKGAHIINASWGDASYSLALANAISRARDSGIIFVAAASNEGQNNDLLPTYPANYRLDNIIAVGALDRSGQVASFSNYGAHSVHLMAPGQSIYSTWYTANDAYATENGTSMATPYVTGALALLKAAYPNENYRQLIARLLSNTKAVPAAAGKCVTGGLVDVASALKATTVPSFTASAWVGAAPMQLWVTNTSVGNIAGFGWDFGDGSTFSASSNLGHTYETAGHYTVRLSVTNNAGETRQAAREVAVLAKYLVQSTNYAWIDPATMAKLSLTNNGVSVAQAIPFPFRFYDTTNTQVFIGANGVIGFKAEELDLTENLDLPHSQPPYGILCPYWDGLNVSGQGVVYVGTVGAAPTRRFVMSWVNIPLAASSTTLLTFQAILTEGSPNILFQYREVSPAKTRGAARRATVGVENDTGTVFTKFTYNGAPAVLANSQALAFVPQPSQHKPPVVAITNPSNGVWFAAPAAFELAAEASVVTGSIVQVEFFAGTNSLGVVTSSPYTLAVTNLGAGVYTLTAQAIDDKGMANSSETITVTVVEPQVLIPPLLGNPGFLEQGGFQFRLTELAPGTALIVEQSEDLITWTSLVTNTVSEATWTFIDTNAADFPRRYYRVVR